MWDIVVEMPMTIAHVAERDPELVYGALLFSLLMSSALIWIVFRFVLRSKFGMNAPSLIAEIAIATQERLRKRAQEQRQGLASESLVGNDGSVRNRKKAEGEPNATREVLSTGS